MKGDYYRYLAEIAKDDDNDGSSEYIISSHL